MLCHHISLNLCSGTHQCQRWSHLQGCWLAQLFLKLGKLLFTRATIDSLNKLWDVGGDSETSMGFTSDVIIMPSFSPLIPLLLPLSLPSLQFSLLLSIAASHHCQIYINLFVTLCSSVSPIALIPPQFCPSVAPSFSYLYCLSYKWTEHRDWKNNRVEGVIREKKWSGVLHRETERRDNATLENQSSWQHCGNPGRTSLLIKKLINCLLIA